MKKYLTQIAQINALLILLILCAPAYAQKQTPPPGGKPKDFKLPEKKQGQLPNGLKTTMVQFGAVPKVTVQVIIKTGNVHEGPEQVWLADLTGDLLKEGGTTTMDFKTISKKVAGMGGDIFVNVGLDQTYISGSVLSEFTPDLIKIIADMVINPKFPESEIARLKDDLKRTLSVQKEIPQSKAQEKFMGTIYAGQSYGRYFPTEKMIDSYTVDMVKGFYDANFGAKRTVVYVAGKFDEAVATKAIEDAFKGFKTGPEVSYPQVNQVKTNQVSIIDRPNAPQTTVIIGLPTLTPKNPDVVALQVTNAILGGSFSSRITTNLREDKGFTYSPSSTIRNDKGVSIWYEQADVTSANTGESLQEIAKEINKLQKEAPSETELNGIKNYMAGIFVLQNSSPGGIIGQLNFLDLHELDDSYLTNRVNNILAVTPDQVSKMAKEHFKYEDMTVVLVGDKKLLNKQMKAHEDAKKLK
ncbi:MAG: pitrilysin family protein [Bacteroidota bacterium]